MNNPELRPQTPTLDELAQNPNKITNEILRAIGSGNLNPEFVEQHLALVVQEARNVNATNLEIGKREQAKAIDTVKQALLVKLAMFSGNRESLFATLKKFCKNNNLDLYPKPDWAVRAYEDSKFKADWYSHDNKFALKISDDMIFVFKKFGNQWIGEAEKYE